MIENVYQHFRKEEQSFIDTVIGWIRNVEDQYTPYLTNFLDPRQLHIVKQSLGKIARLLFILLEDMKQQRG